MKAKEIFKKRILERIANTSICCLIYHGRLKHQLLSYAYAKGIINDEEIYSIFDQALIKQARRDYKLLFKKHHLPFYIDHDIYSEGLIYALEKGEFSKKEIKKIPLDIYKNVKEFIRFNRNKNILEDLKETLLNPTPEIKQNGPLGVCLEH